MNYPVSTRLSASFVLQLCVTLLLVFLSMVLVAETVSFFRLFETPLVINPAFNLIR